MAETERSISSLDYRYYLDLLLQGKWTIIAAVVLCVGIAFVSGLLRTPLYRAQATVSVELPPPQPDPTSAVIPQFNSFYDYDYYFKTQLRIITSNQVLERAAAELVKLPQYHGKSMGELVGPLARSTATVFVQDTRLIQIAVTRESAEEAALWANAITEAYIENNMEARRKSFKETLEALNSLLEKNQENRVKAIEGLQRALRDLGIVQAQEAGTRLDTGALDAANRNLAQAQQERQGIEARYQQALQSRGSPQAVAQLVQKDSELGALIQEKAKLEKELKDLIAKGFGERNPTLIQKKGQLAAIEQQISAATEDAIAALRSELDAARLKEEQAFKVREIEQRRIQSASTDPQVLDNVIQQAISSDITRELKQVLNRVQLSGLLLTNNITLVDRAVPPGTPINPQSTRVLILGFFAGLMLGAGIVLAKDFVDNTIRDPEEIERVLGLPDIGEIPHATEGAEVVLREAYNALWTNIKFSRRGSGPQAILVTSSTIEEGKTTVCAELARTAATLGGRTLVIDLDLRRPKLHKHFATPGKRMDDSSAILIVDDEEAIRNLLAESISQLLSSQGREWVSPRVSQILTASSGSEALGLIDGDRVAVAIIDINLPGMDGIQLLGRIKERSPQTEVIIITGYASLETAIEAVRKGAYDYITKPLEIDSLMRTISKALDKWALLVENRKLLQPIANVEGLSAYLAGDAELDSIMCPTEVRNLWLIPAGKPPQNPFALLDRTILSEFLKAAKRRFDWIIIDSPPVASVSDPAVIASIADCVLLVVRYNRTDRKLVRRVVKVIRRANDHILGIVLNDIQAAKRRYYRDRYGYRYHYGYSREKDEPTTSLKKSVRKLFAIKGGVFDFESRAKESQAQCEEKDGQREL